MIANSLGRVESVDRAIPYVAKMPASWKNEPVHGEGADRNQHDPDVHDGVDARRRAGEATQVAIRPEPTSEVVAT
jgi:hypothetical protein